MRHSVKLALASLGAFAALAPIQAHAACDPELVAATRNAAFNSSVPLPKEAVEIGYREAFTFAECIGLPAVRRLLLEHEFGRVTLPPHVLDAFRFKSPNTYNRRRSDAD